MIKQSLSILALSALLSASTTMCYKKDHFDPETIENIPLKGSECKNEFSVKDMKEKGYIVKDIKISTGDAGLNYIYIFNTPGSDLAAQAKQSGGVFLTKENLREHLKAYQDEERKIKEEKEAKVSAESGKKKYEKLCRRCHGDGTISAYNVAKPLKSLTKDQFERAINEYDLDERKGPLAIIMKPYADLVTSDDIENIYNYIQTLQK